jgi:hypothetical protein
MNYQDTTEDELYLILEKYSVNVQMVREMSLGLNALRDFVHCLDRLLESADRLDALEK